MKLDSNASAHKPKKPSVYPHLRSSSTGHVVISPNRNGSNMAKKTVLPILAARKDAHNIAPAYCRRVAWTNEVWSDFLVLIAIPT